MAAGVKELREVLAAAHNRLLAGGERTLLFIDEIHRFNKAQQDVLLPGVEEGEVILVGATTENPFFTVNRRWSAAAASSSSNRSAIDDIKSLLIRAAPIHAAVWANIRSIYTTTPWSSSRKRATATPAAPVGVGSRRALQQPAAGRVHPRLAEESVQRKAVQYDRDGDSHYDSISALIKSIRGSDPDASLYWLARMLEGGEDVRFLARRLVILASEDVGNADPAALPLAVAAAHACEMSGCPNVSSRWPRR